MDLELSEQQKELQNAAIEFARSELNDDVIRRDRDEIFSFEGWKKCAHFGAMGLPIPTEYGGMGLGITEVIAVMEGLGYGARDHGLLFSINAHLWTNSLPILVYGTEAQRLKYLPGLSNGDLIGANGASEPGAGSDIFSMRTSAERRGDCYVLNGTKTFVSNGPVANLFAVYATVDAKLGAMGITAFLVEGGTPGLTVTRKLWRRWGCARRPCPKWYSIIARFPLPTVWGGRAGACRFSNRPWNGSGAVFSPTVSA